MQQQLGRQARSAAGGRRAAAAQRPFTPAGRHPLLPQCAAATSNGNGKHPVAAAAAPVAKTPSPAQTARTIVDITNEGTLCSVSASGVPVGIPVAFSVDKAGKLHVHLDAGALEMSNLQSNSSCSLTVQPTALPARAVGAVTLVGKVNVASDSCDLVSCDLVMALEKCLYFGGLDLSARGLEVSAEEYAAAEPDVLRKAAPEFVNAWNTEHAEDVYRIVSDFIGVPLTEMSYAELLWVDQLGMYVRCEVNGREPSVVRVPFYRPVLDERDARSVVTMAAQIAWERERNYNPPIPAVFAGVVNDN